MGYSDLDQLAINTIRVLAVCFPPLSPSMEDSSCAIGSPPISTMRWLQLCCSYKALLDRD